MSTPFEQLQNDTIGTSDISSSARSAFDDLASGASDTSIYEQPTKKKTAVGQFLSGVGTALTRDVAANFKTVLPTLDRTLYNSIVNMRGEGYIPREQALTYYQDKQKKVDEYKQKTEDKLKAKLGEDYNSLSMQWGRTLGQGVTQIGSYYVPVVGPGLAVTLNSAQIGASAQNDYRDAYEGTIAKGGSKQEATKNARIVGTVSGVVNSAEALVPGKIMFAEKLMGKGFYNGLKQFAKTAVIETLTEGLQDTTVSLAKQQTYDENANPIKDGLTSMLISLPSSLLFGGVDVVSNKVSQAKLQETARAMVVDQIKKGVAPDIAVDNAVNIISTMSDFSEGDIFQNVGRDILEQSKDASELFQMEMDRQIADPTYVPDKSKMEFAKEIIRAKNIYDMSNAQEIGVTTREDGSTVKMEVIPYADNMIKVKATITMPDGTEQVHEVEKVASSMDEAYNEAKSLLSDQEIEVGTGPLFRMREPIDNNQEMVDTTISDTGTSKPEQVDKTINKQYDTRTISKRTEDTVGGIQNASDRATQYMGRLLRMEQIQDSTRTDTGGENQYNKDGVRIKVKELVEMYRSGKSIPITNYSIGALVDIGMREDTADVIISFSKQKNNPIQKIEIVNSNNGFVAFFNGKNSLIINERIIGSMTPNEMKHEYSHAWFNSQTREFKQEFVNQLKLDKELIYEAWSNTTSPYNDYAKQQFELLEEKLIDVGYTKQQSGKILNDSGLKSSYETVNEFIDDSFNIMSYIENINSVLVSDGKGRFFFREYNSVAINEHIAVIAEFSEELESDNEIINNFIEMSDNGTYDFGTALQDKGPSYLRQKEIPLGQLVEEYNKNFATDADSLEERIEHGKEYISILNEQIRMHPGKELVRLISRKEGQFIEDQFAFYDNPKNATQKLHNERAKKLGSKVASIIEEYGIDGEYNGKFAMADVAQTVYNEYAQLLKNKQNFLESLRDDKKKFKEQTAAQKGITKTLAENAMSALKRSLIAPKDRKKWMVKAAEIGTDQVKWKEYIDDITRETEQIMIEQAIKLEKAAQVREISALRQINDMSPVMIASVKKKLGIEGPINKLSLRNLLDMRAEIEKRVEFLERNGYNIATSMRTPSLEEGEYIAKKAEELEKTTAGRVAKKVGGFISRTAKKIPGMRERLKSISGELEALVASRDFEIGYRYEEEFAPVIKRFAEVAGKLKGVEKINFKLQLLNSRYDNAAEILKRNGLDTSSLNEIQTLLKQLYEELRAVGVDIRELQGYFPRFLTEEGMRDARAITMMTDEAIKQYELTHGESPDSEQVSKIFGDTLRGININGKVLLEEGRFGQRRTLDKINNADQLNLFVEPENGIDFYVKAALDVIQTRRMFNKFDSSFISKVQDESYDNGIKMFVEDAVNRGWVKPNDLREAQEIMQTVLAKDRKNEFVDGLIQSTYIMGLGKLTAFVPQAFETIMYLGMEGLPKNMNLLPSDIGIGSSFDVDTTVKNKIIKWIMKPLEFGDVNVAGRYGVNAITYNIVKDLNADKNSDRFKDRYEQMKYIFGKNTDVVIDKIKDYDFKSKLPKELARVAYSGMSNYRVLSKFDKSELFVGNGYAKMFGVFRNFTIKMLSNTLYMNNKKIAKEWESGNKLKAMKLFSNKLKFISYLMIAGFSQQVIRDMIKGSFDYDDEDWALNYALDSFFKIFMLSRYGFENLDRLGGPGSMAADIFAPAPASIAFDTVDSIYKDITDEYLFDLEETKSLTRIPIIGEIIKSTAQRKD